MVEGSIELSVATEIVAVIQEFHYTGWDDQPSAFVEQLMADVGQSVVLFLSGRAENIYPTEPGVFAPGEVDPSKRKRHIIDHEGRGADDDVRER